MDTASELFARHGYHGTSIRDIAKAVGVTAGAIYVHFPSKSHLLLAIYRTGVERIGAAIDAAIAGETDGWARLEAAARAHLDMVLDRSGYAQVVIRVLPSDVDDMSDNMIVLRDQYEARFKRLIDTIDTDPGIDRGLLRLSVIGALNWTQTWFRPGRHDTGAIARQLVRGLRHGVASESNET